mgnify:CR=1 FL=1
MEKEKIKIEKTKKGFPCLWESGGGFTNTGEATIIASPSGGPKKPVYVRRRGHLANAHHALVILEVGDYIIKCNHHRGDFEITVYKIVNFEEVKKKEVTETYAVVEQENYFSMGEWDAELPASLEAAVQAAMQKATCYHCREPHFIIVE